jgi:OOP family OmpA-OmpF porin
VGGLFIEPASTPAHLDSNVGLSLSYARVPVRLHGMITGEVFNVIAHQLTGDLVGSIGLGENYSVGIDLPFIVAQTGDTLTKRETEVLGPMNLPAQAFGDVALTVKAVLIQPTAGKMGGFALAFHNRFTVPTGDRGSFLGEGHVTNTSRLFAETSPPNPLSSSASLVERGSPERAFFWLPPLHAALRSNAELETGAMRSWRGGPGG